jgi:hypothetical protein
MLSVVLLPGAVNNSDLNQGLRGHDHMIVGFTTTYAISAYHR